MTAKAARIAGIVACLVVLTGLILLLAQPHRVPARIAGLGTAKIQAVELEGLAWIVFGCAAWLARKAAVKVVVGLILVGGIALQVAALTAPPQTSTDLYRYIWDGRVQAAGVDPYLYAPADAGVARLRNDFLWSGNGTGHYKDCVAGRTDSAEPADGLVAGCTKINRMSVPTIYPPVAEAYFTAVQLAAPADDSTTPIQAGAAVFAVLTAVILLFGLRRYDKDPRLAALWAWCPTVALEAGQNGHVDVVGVAFTATALLVLAGARTRRRIMLGGALLGLAIATKMTPVLAVPGVLRRGWRLIATAAVSAIVLVYVPHLIAVGSKVIGFLPGYLNQQGYSTGTGYALLGMVVRGKASTLVAVIILGVVAAAILRYCDPHRPWHGGVLMTAAALAVCTPEFQWYSILLVMLVALDGQPEWLLLSAGGYLASTGHVYIHGFMLRHTQLIGYGAATVIAGTISLTRVFRARRARRLAAPVDGTLGADEVLTADKVLAEGGALAEDGALVIEPTAVFSTPGLRDTGSYRVLTTAEITERAESRRS